MARKHSRRAALLGVLGTALLGRAPVAAKPSRCRSKNQSCNPFTNSCCPGLFCSPFFICASLDDPVPDEPLPGRCRPKTTEHPENPDAADCPGRQQVCCGADTPQAGKCVGRARACFKGEA